MFDSNERINFLKSFINNNPEYYNNKELVLSNLDSNKKNAINLNKKSLQRWEYLYKLNKVNNNKLINKISKKQKEENIKELNECTFSPRIHPNNKLLNSDINYFNNNFRLLNNQSFVDRTYAWKKRKDSKINEKIKKKEDNCRKQCTFMPNKNKSLNYDYDNTTDNPIRLEDLVKECPAFNYSKKKENYNNCINKFNIIENNTSRDALSNSITYLEFVNNADSYNKFIKRKESYRKEKKDKQIELSSRPGSGLNYNGKLTRIKSFKLETSLTRDKRSNSNIRSLNKVSKMLFNMFMY